MSSCHCQCPAIRSTTYDIGDTEIHYEVHGCDLAEVGRIADLVNEFIRSIEGK